MPCFSGDGVRPRRGGVGAGRAEAAIQAAKLGNSVALVERHSSLGGACVNTGTIPSKTIREAILYLTGLNQRAIYGQSYRLKESVSIDDIRSGHDTSSRRNGSVIRDQLLRNHVTLFDGCARFVDAHTLAIDGRDDTERRVSANGIVLATGSTPAHPAGIEFNGSTVLDSDDIVLRLGTLPSTIVIVGAGVIGVEFASMFAALGSRVTIVDAREAMLDFCDPEITEALRYHLRELNVVFRFGERVERVEARDNGTLTTLASGKVIPADVVFYSAGRVGAVSDLRLENAGIEADERGRIHVDERFRTAQPHIYAVGDVVGFPSLASASAEQGRLAACHLFGIPDHAGEAPLPIGIYSIPEISYVGKTEPELTAAMIPYEIGISHYRELGARTDPR